MAARGSLNKVMLIGNLTRDPELRYTPQGNAVCSFTVATNRSWQPSEGGERREETEFHRVVAWNKLGELCSQLLSKGRKVYVEGRLQTRNWQTADGQNRQTTEVVITDMNLLDSRKNFESGGAMGEVEEFVSDTAGGGMDDFSQLEDVSTEELDETPIETVDEGGAIPEKEDSKPKKSTKKKEAEEPEDDLPF